MEYALVENNQVTRVGLPSIGVLKNGSTVSGYNLLDVNTLKNEGWLPLEENKQTFDSTKQYLQHSGYTIQADKVISNYIAVDIVVPTPIAPQPTSQDLVNAKLLKDSADMQVQLQAQQKLNADLMLKVASLGGK